MTVQGFSYLQNDEIFKKLAKKLDMCSEQHNGCENCQLQADCCKFFDWVSDRASDRTLKPEDRQWFEAQYQKLFKQLNLFEEGGL